MRDETVAKNYAETLFDLAQRHGGIEAFGEAIDVVAGVLDAEPTVRLFLETPRIAAAEKKAVVRKVLGPKVPQLFLSFLLVTIDKRRQRLLRDIARQYKALVDQHLGREHVEVTVAHAMDEGTRALLDRGLSELLGKKAIPHVRVSPDILGGVIIRTGETIYDGSIRRRLEGMRRQLLEARLPAASRG